MLITGANMVNSCFQSILLVKTRLIVMHGYI